MTRRRAGSAVVAALALVALAGALLAATAGQGTAAARAWLLERMAAQLEGQARRALADAVLAWPAAADSLAVGAFAERAVHRVADSSGGPAMRGALRIQRLAPALYALTVELRVETGEPAVLVVRRRLRLLVRRDGEPPGGDGTGAVSSIARWPLADLP